MMLRILLLIVLASLHNVIAAQNDTAKSLTTIVVTVTRDSMPLSSANVAINVMQRTAMNQVSSRSVPEMLQEQPGVWMQKTSHAGGSPFIRGLTGNQVLQMIDGIRLNNATFRYGPNQYLSTIDPFSLQQVEVLRNAYSTLYGSDAMGGIVNVISSDPQFSPNGIKVNGAFGIKGMTSDMEKTASGKIVLRDKNFAWETVGTVSDFGDALAANQVMQIPTSYTQYAGSSKLKYRISDHHELTAAYQYVRQNDVDLFDQVTQRNFTFNKIWIQERQLGYLRSRINIKKGLIKSVTTTASINYSDEARSRQRDSSPVINQERDKVTTYGLQFDIPMQFNVRWKARSGIDIYHDKVRSTASDSNTSTSVTVEKRGLYADGSTMSSYSLFHQQYYELTKWQFSAGLRLNAYDTRIIDPTFGNLRFSPVALAGNLSATFVFNKQWRLTASANSAYRAPNISDLSSFGKFDFGIEVPAPDLEPERSLNKELLVHVTQNRNWLAFGIFHNSLTNLIDRKKSTYEEDTVYNGDRVYQKTNIGDAVIYGAESYFHFELKKHWSFDGNIAYTLGENTTSNHPLRRIPPLFARLNIQYQLGKFYSLLNWNIAGEQERLAPGDLSDHRINPKGTPGYGILSVRAGWEISVFSLEAGMENILDQAYRIHGSGIDGYGRHLWIRTMVKF